MEYFYNDELRWAFGFDNPNKAAVLFACVLAMVWMLWMLAWRIGRRWLRIMTLLASGAAVIIVTYLLFKTYSRGGLIAGGGALAYMIARTIFPGRWGRGRYIAEALLLCSLAVSLWGTGLLSRTVEPLRTTDASVENRLILWQRALQMAADNPAGFGIGKSGEAYMNWYQPVEMTAGYRTMVNSYLTALVEWGWLAFVGATLLAAFLWGWANPGKGGFVGFDVATGLRGTVLAFAIGGMFSTTMEAGVLWILPGLCAAALIIWAAYERRPPRSAATIVALTAAICATSAVTGWLLTFRDKEVRKFRCTADRGDMVQIGPRGSLHEKWVVVPDSIVLGASYGKLLRALALGIGSPLQAQTALTGSQKRVILAGEAVQQVKLSRCETLVLLAPEVISEKDAGALLTHASNVVIFVPDFDEDGRAEFWREIASKKSGVEVVTVEGVGRQLDWGWDQVIERVGAL